MIAPLFTKGTFMLKSIVAFGLLTSLTSFAATMTEADRAAKAAYCEQRLSTDNSVQQLLTKQENHLGFTNHGGMMNGGVCWWHSRYTRNAAYLVQFRPDLPRIIDQKGIKKLVMDIRKGKKVVVVPGYRNLREFSYAHYQEIQDKLEDWQETDGILNFQWVAGLSGKSEVSEENLSLKMDQLFARITRGEVVYQKLQLPGIVAHAWLVVGMSQLPEGGYRLQVIDSNYAGVQTFTFRPGMKSMGYVMGSFVPYTGKTKEESRLRRILKKECKDFLAERALLAEREAADEDETLDAEEN